MFASASIDYLRPQTASSHGDDFLRVVGSEGVIEVHEGRAHLINDEREGVQELPALCDRQIFVDFVDHVRGRATALIDAEQTFTVTEMCLLARQSADEGKLIER